MTEIPSSSELYDRDVRESYQRTLAETYDRVLKDATPDRLHFGPTFSTETSKDMPVNIFTLWVDPKPGEEIVMDQGRLPLVKSYLLLALDNQGNLVGDRYVQLGNKRDWLEARGGIATARRGQGISSCLETATFWLLRVEASKQREYIYWHVENGNQERIKRAEEKYVNSKEPEAAAALETIRAEQKAWLALYGPEGKFGFNWGGTLEIEPDRDYSVYTPEHTDAAKLSSWTQESRSGGRIFVTNVRSEKRGDKAELHSKKLERLQNEILPKIQEILSVGS